MASMEREPGLPSLYSGLIMVDAWLQHLPIPLLNSFSPDLHNLYGSILERLEQLPLCPCGGGDANGNANACPALALAL